MKIIQYNDPYLRIVPELLGQDMLKRMTYPCYAEMKIDGEFCTADTLNIPETGLLIGKHGKARTECPILKQLPNNSIILGELYHGDGKAGALYSLLSNACSDILRFAAFDIVHHEGRNMSAMPYEERRELLLNLMSECGNSYQRALLHTTSVVETYYCEDLDDVNHVLELSKGKGYEGIVVKGTGPVGVNWVKIKHTETADLEVSFVDPSQERIEVKVPHPANHNLSRIVGVKVMNKIKQTLSVGDIVEIKHFGVLSGGGLRHPSFVRRREPKRVSI